MTKQNLRFFSLIGSLLLLSQLGCGLMSSSLSDRAGVRYDGLAKDSYAPPGVVRYCWEEPMVEFEPNGPGVDVDGHWYHPFYLAVREVRSGRWRPCSAGR